MFLAFAPKVLAVDTASIAASLGITGVSVTIFQITAGLGTFIAWLGGGLLDIAIGLFLVDMVGTLDWLQFQSLILSLWEIIRDLFNLLFIFGLIYAGFKLILGIDDSGSKRTIGYIVIAALLINFSLYAVQVTVDVGNVIAGRIYKQITTDAAIGALGDSEIGSVSDNFTRFVQIERLANEANELTKIENIEGNVNTWWGAFLLGLVFLFFFTLLGFMFAAGAILLFGRFVMLIGFMVFSPILLLGLIFPKLAGATSSWPKMFLNQVIVGPLYLFMLYLSLRAVQNLPNLPQLTIINITLYVGLVSAFLWGSLMISKKFGAVGADRALAWGGNMGRSIRGGVTGFAGRNTVGWGANKLQNRFTSWQAKESNSRLGRLARGIVAGTNLDRGIINATNKAKNASFGGTSFEANKKNREERAKRLGKDGVMLKIADSLQTGATSSDPDEKIKMERAISGASNEHILELLKDNKPDSQTYKAIVANMSSGQFEAAMKAKTDELNDADKEALNNARKRAITETLTASEREKDRKAKEADPSFTERKESELMRVSIKNASDAQLKVLGTAQLKEHAAMLKQSQFDDIMKSKDYTESEKAQIRTAREDKLKSLFDSDKDRAEMFKGLQDKDIASLPKDILKDTRAIPFITGGALKKMAEDDKITEQDRIMIKDQLHAAGKDSRDTAVKYLKSPQGQEKYGDWPEDIKSGKGTKTDSETT